MTLTPCSPNHFHARVCLTMSALADSRSMHAPGGSPLKTSAGSVCNSRGGPPLLISPGASFSRPNVGIPTEKWHRGVDMFFRGSIARPLSLDGQSRESLQLPARRKAGCPEPDIPPLFHMTRPCMP
jgi:hypothetical protein